MDSRCCDLAAPDLICLKVHVTQVAAFVSELVARDEGRWWVDFEVARTLRDG